MDSTLLAKSPTVSRSTAAPPCRRFSRSSMYLLLSSPHLWVITSPMLFFCSRQFSSVCQFRAGMAMPTKRAVCSTCRSKASKALML